MAKTNYRVAWAASVAGLAASLMVLAMGAGSAEAAFPGGTGDIAFSSTRGGGEQIYRMGGDGYDPTRLTDTAGLNREPSWSADGKKITFTNITFPNNSESPEVFRMNADGSGEVNLTNDPALDQRPSWSAAAIAFDSSRTGNGDIYLMILDGIGQPLATTRMTTNASAVDFNAVISPDGRRIAFDSDRSGNEDIYVMKANVPEGPANRPVRLTRNAAVDDHPEWSPNGTQLAFASRRTGNYEVFRMKAVPEGRKNRPLNLSRNASTDISPAWSPDGKQIAFSSSRSSDSEIWRMRATDGGNQVKLTNDPAQDVGPSWQPLP
jgi:Tol biopolymer transport system component